MPTLIRPLLVLFGAVFVLTGVAYPAIVTACAQAWFPDAAMGSLLLRDGRVIGSALIGQEFRDPAHFWGRPSATTPQPYHAANSGGSNLGPLNPALREAAVARIAALRAADPDNRAPVPVDLVTASASGLDPHISVAAARYQAQRVARARGLDTRLVEALIDAEAQGRTFGVIGEPQVNVLALNLALERMTR